MIELLLLMISFAPPPKSVNDGVYTVDQASRGKELYAKQCASCHGAMLTGGESAPPLVGGEFISNWNGLTAWDLFVRVRKTMPQNKPGSLALADNADVIAYMFKMNEFPTGAVELGTKTESLSQITIEPKK